MDGTVPTRRVGLHLLLIAIGCVALLAAELMLRIAGIGRDQFERPDPVLGVRFITAKTGLNQSSCFTTSVSTNSHGWRSRETSLAKPEGVYRVLVLGDSFMAGLQVQDHETFSSVLEAGLNQQGLRSRVEVINFGVPSWGTDQEYLALREYGLDFMPDLVLLAFYSQNDVSDNYSVLLSRGSTYPKPFFDIQDGQLVELPFSDPTPIPIAVGRRLAAPFRLYPWVRDSLLQIPAAHRVLYSLGIVGVVPEEGRSSEANDAALWKWPGRWKRQIDVYRRDYSDEWSHAWKITEGIVKRLRDEVKGAGAALLLLEVSAPVAVLPISLMSRLVAAGGFDSIDVDKPTTLLKQLAERNKIDLVSLVPGFRERVGNSEAAFAKYYLSCDGHWTPAGHRLAAELVAPAIVARIARLH